MLANWYILNAGIQINVIHSWFYLCDIAEKMRLIVLGVKIKPIISKLRRIDSVLSVKEYNSKARVYAGKC